MRSSTLFALKKAACVVSVESDLDWLRAVQTRVAMAGASGRFEPIGVHIGLTKELGYPVIGAPSRRRVARWSHYPKAPWTPGRGPVDLVLIEGRFRVACALQSILSTSSETLIVLDDYFLKNQADRGYGAILRYVADFRLIDGRTAVFRRNPKLDLFLARADFEQFAADPR